MELRRAFCLAAIHVHDVSQKLERIERDADRQGNVRNVFGYAEDCLQVLRKEAGVFKNRQQAEADDYGADQCELCRSLSAV